MIVLGEEGGGRTWARTKDPLIKSQLLYQLSYASTLPFRCDLAIVPVRRECPFSGCRADEKRFFARARKFRQFSPLGRRCQRFTAMIVPTQIMLVIIEEPPWLMKGRGMPTTGARPMTIIRLIAT